MYSFNLSNQPLQITHDKKFKFYCIYLKNLMLSVIVLFESLFLGVSISFISFLKRPKHERFHLRSNFHFRWKVDYNFKISTHLTLFSFLIFLWSHIILILEQFVRRTCLGQIILLFIPDFYPRPSQDKASQEHSFHKLRSDSQSFSVLNGISVSRFNWSKLK